MRATITLISAAGVLFGLAACGQEPQGRLAGGTGGGAATGAVIGLIGGPVGVVVGAAIGGAAGALTSTNTTPKQVNLGPPPWQPPA